MRVPRAYCISGHNRKAAAFTSSEAITTYSIVLLHVYWAQVEADFLEGLCYVMVGDDYRTVRYGR